MSNKLLLDAACKHNAKYDIMCKYLVKSVVKIDFFLYKLIFDLHIMFALVYNCILLNDTYFVIFYGIN